jgi:hypothetical protein
MEAGQWAGRLNQTPPNPQGLGGFLGAMKYNPNLALRGCQWMLCQGMSYPGIDEAMEILPSIVRLFKDKGIECK